MRNLKIAKMSTVIPRSSFTYQEQKDTLTPSQLKAALIGLLFLSFEFASGSAAEMNAQRNKKEPSGNNQWSHPFLNGIRSDRSIPDRSKSDRSTVE